MDALDPTPDDLLPAPLAQFSARDQIAMAEALDLDTTGLGTQVLRLRNVQASGALIAAVAVMVASPAAWMVTVPSEATVATLSRLLA